MTQIVPRRLFDDIEEPKIEEPKFVRVSGSIPEQLNERFKTMARRHDKTADAFIGEMLMSLEPVMDQMEAKIEAERLRKQFGDDWLSILQQAEPGLA
jgi:hypothetical protein